MVALVELKAGDPRLRPRRGFEGGDEQVAVACALHVLDVRHVQSIQPRTRLHRFPACYVSMYTAAMRYWRLNAELVAQFLVALLIGVPIFAVGAWVIWCFDLG